MVEISQVDFVQLRDYENELKNYAYFINGAILNKERLEEKRIALQEKGLVFEATLEPTHTIISFAALEKLLRDSEELDALKQGGVDNWEWASESIDNYIRANPGSILAGERKEVEDDGA